MTLSEEGAQRYREGLPKSARRLAGVLARACCTQALPLNYNRSNPPARAMKNLNSILEPIQQSYKLPALAAAIVTSEGMSAIGAVGEKRFAHSESLPQIRQDFPNRTNPGCREKLR